MSAVVPLTTRVTLVVLIVEAVIASLNVAVTFVPTATPVAPLAGAVPVTVGGVGSGAAAAGTVQGLSRARASPAGAFPPGPSPFTVAREVGEAAGLAVGLSVAVEVVGAEL